MEVIECILAPVSKLRTNGLKDLFIFTPRERVFQNYEVRDAREKRLEKWIMGEEYESDCATRRELSGRRPPYDTWFYSSL